MKAHQIALHLLLRYITNSSNYKDSEHNNKIPPLIAVEVTFQQDSVINHSYSKRWCYARGAPVTETRPTSVRRRWGSITWCTSSHDEVANFGVGECNLLTDTTKHTHHACDFPLQMSKRFRKAARYTRTSRYSGPVRRTRRYQPKATARMASV